MQGEREKKEMEKELNNNIIYAEASQLQDVLPDCSGVLQPNPVSGVPRIHLHPLQRQYVNINVFWVENILYYGLFTTDESESYWFC